MSEMEKTMTDSIVLNALNDTLRQTKSLRDFARSTLDRYRSQVDEIEILLPEREREIAELEDAIRKLQAAE